MTEREKGILETALFGVWIFVVFVFVVQLHFGIQLHELEQKMERLELKQTKLTQIYTGLTIGKVIDKQEKDGKYTLTIAGYGNFLVKKETYEESILGADMPKEIKERVEVKKGVGDSMTEKLKYKVGDKVWIEAEVDEVDSTSEYQYGLTYSKTGDFIRWVTEDKLDKVSVTNPPKPKITQAMMDWYKNKYKESDSVWKVLDYFANEPLNENSIAYWLYASNDKEQMQLRKERQHAIATLIAYGPESVEVEKEKRYRVYLVGVKNQWNQRQCLTNNEDNYFFSGRCMVDTTYTKQEIIKAGFGDVFDNPMFEVEEVE